MASPNPRSPKRYDKDPDDLSGVVPSRALRRQSQADLARMAGATESSASGNFDPDYGRNAGLLGSLGDNLLEAMARAKLRRR